MSRSNSEEMLAVLWFILALFLWKYEFKILSIISLVKGLECAVCCVFFSIATSIKWTILRKIERQKCEIKKYYDGGEEK